MYSRESLHPPHPPHHHHHHHHHHPPPLHSQSLISPPPPQHPNNTTTATHNNHSINPNSSTTPTFMMQQHQQNARSPFNSNTQYGGGDGDRSSPGGFSIEAAAAAAAEAARKKRGRPSKYSPPSSSEDGNNIALGLTPAPITPMSDNSGKKARGRPAGSGKKQLDALGSFGIGFTPHVITVNTGEDVASKIMAFSQQGPRTVCILSANGAVCNVTLRQPSISGSTVTYEGRFEIISLTGSFLLSEINGNRSRTGGLNVSLAGPDGRVLGGGVAGVLMAATPVQVIVGSFIADGKKPKSGSTSSPPTNMLNFGALPFPESSPPSEGGSSESSDEGGSSPNNNRLSAPTSYNNASTQQHIQNIPMYANNIWPNSTMNMLPN